MLRVWVDAWQMQCCGTPFSVGSKASWHLGVKTINEFNVAVLGEDVAATITHFEDHHIDLPEDTPLTTGTVRRIRAASCTYKKAEHEKHFAPVPNTLVLAEKSSADGWERDSGHQRFVGYLVDLEPDES